MEGFLFYVHLQGNDKFKVNRTLFILDFGTTIVFLLAVESHRFASVADPDLPIRGGWGGHLDLEISVEGRSPKKFFPPFGPQFGLKMGVGLRVPPLDPPLCLLCELFENLFTELAGKLGFAHSFGFIFYGTKPWKNTPENVELSEFFFFFTCTDYIYSSCIYVVALYVFVIFWRKEPTERTPFGELFGR